MLVQSICTSFRVELLTALHDFTPATGDVFKLALFRAQADITGFFGSTTTNYSDMGADEATGAGYAAGGYTLTTVAPTSEGDTAYTNFVTLVEAGVTLVTSGALIYNSSQGNRAVAVLDFGGDKTLVAQTLTAGFPLSTGALALIRLLEPN